MSSIPAIPGYNHGATPSRDSAFEFFVSNMEHFQNRFKEVKYQDIFWRKVVPAEAVDTGVNPGANTVSYPVEDWRGQGAFRARVGDNIPTVGAEFGKNNIPVQAAGVAAVVDTDEVRAVMFGMSLDLRTRFPEIMRKACDRHVESAFFYGDPAVGFLPFLDFPGVPLATVAAGASGSPLWTGKTPDEILGDLNTAIATVWVNTRQVHLPNAVYLPSGHYGYIASTPRSATSDVSILEYFLKNNICRDQGGGDVSVMPLPYLADAGVGGATRMIVCQRAEENFMMPFPLPFTLLAPQFRGFNIELYAEYKFGAVHLPYPMAFLYQDGF